MSICAKDICFFRGDREILHRVSLTLDDAQPVVLLGPSGIGKTTLLRILAGLERPHSGTVSGLPPHGRVAVLFQEDRLFPTMRVWDNLHLVCPAMTREQAVQLLHELGLDASVLSHYPRQLSGGMRRRVALARALSFPAQAVLLDEPCQGLDAQARTQALESIARHTRGRPLLVVSHEREDAAVLGARVVCWGDDCPPPIKQ